MKIKLFAVGPDGVFFFFFFNFDLQCNLCKELSSSSTAKRVRKCLITPSWGGFS